METVSKFTLNPLATCFIPSSMKYRSMSPVIFSVPSCEAAVNEYTEARNGQFLTTTKEKNIGYSKAIKAQSTSTRAEIAGDSFVTIEEVKETRSRTVKMDEIVKDPLITKPILSTMNEMSGKETPVKSDDEKTSDRNSTGSKDMVTVDTKDMEAIDSKNTALTNLDLSLLNQTVISKIFEFLKGGTKTFSMLLPFAVRSILVMEFFYRMGLRTISLDMITTSHISSVFKPNLSAVTFPNKDKIAKKKESYGYGSTPVFGWATPTTDYVRTSAVESLKLNPSERSESKESSKVNDDFSLEQCSLELKAVIKDVCDSLSSHDEDHDSTPKTTKRPVWETKTAKEIQRNSDVDLIDDGVHPLLQGKPAVDTEDTEIPKIQALLEQAFSLHENSSGGVLASQSTCNPPCSVWCNKVPSPAKDAYKRFIRKSDSESTAVGKTVTDVKLRKSLYKRCFSADDTPKHYQDKTSFHSASSFESKERLLLLHKDPVAFIKQSRTSALKDINHLSSSNFVCDQAETKDNSTESNSDKWSVYDGADSKWQPLPDCIPSTDSAQKQAHRKARDMRRQKSVS